MDPGIPPAAGKARLEDVARLARLSRSTASRAITGAPGVSEEAAAAVERAARRLNYSPNRAARSLVTRRSDLAGQGVPVVVSGRPLGAVEITYVDVDNPRGGAIATRRLLAAGRRAIATITGPQDMVAGRDRLVGYRQAMTDAGLLDRSLEEPGDFTRESGHAAMRALLERRPDLDAVFAASDLMALGAMQALREAGRRVPDDVAVVGFDDSPAAASAQPPLSSVRWPLDEMAREMTRLLLRAIEDRSPPPRGVLLATRLTARASSGAAGA